MPGDLIASLASRIFDSVCPPCSYAISLSSNILTYCGLIVPKSDTKTSKPFFFANIAAPTPLSPAPKTTILLMTFQLFYSLIIYYLIFSVNTDTTASINAIIKNLVTILASGRPFFW